MTSFLDGAASVASEMIVHPAVQFKAIESDALGADAQLENVGSDFGVEPVPVHAEVARRVPKPDKPREDRLCRLLHVVPPIVLRPLL